MTRLACLYAFCFLFFPFRGEAQHPKLLFTSAEATEISKGLNNFPLLHRSFENVKDIADEALAEGVDVPIPKDPDGGYTHGRHKKNYTDALNAGIAYNITGQQKYAAYVKDMLLQYAAMYEKLPPHPASKKDQPPGRIFWQNLNDCVWQVYMIQAYDCVYNFLSPQERSTIEQHLFFPVVKFLMVDHAETFDRIHNHGTWCVAAVGLTGYVLNQPQWVNKALKGTKEDGKTGFLKQVERLFSPDGYYTEGPYYERYALMPFMVFAMAIEKYQPQFHIFAYRDSVLLKAVETCIQLTYNTYFFPVNDAIKKKTFITDELIYGVDIAYAYGNKQPGFLSIARQQDAVIVSAMGLQVARDEAAGKAKPFPYRTAWFHDGPNGDQGGLGVLRYKDENNDFCAVLKASALGMGHGHFDKLNLLVYDNGREIIPDYGSVRFINIASKEGGRYLKENNTWAKQTIAHNTITVDQRSNYDAKRSIGDTSHSYRVYFSAQRDMQVLSCADTTAYKGLKLQRTLVLLKTPEEKHPFLIDVFHTTSKGDHQLQLPYYYKGDIIGSAFPLKPFEQELQPYGKKNGFQYLWHTAEGTTDSTASITLLNGNRFYTLTSAAGTASSFDLVMTGASDPNMNLLTEKGIVLNQTTNGNSHVFLNVLDAHGGIDYSAEATRGAGSSVHSLKLISNEAGHVAFSLGTHAKEYRIDINLDDPNNFITIK